MRDDLIIQRHEDRIVALEKGQKEMLDILRPMSEAFTSAGLLIKWGTAFLVFVSIFIGVVISIKEVIKR